MMDVANSPVMLAELIELLQYRYDQIDLVDEPMDIGFDCPLDVVHFEEGIGCGRKSRCRESVVQTGEFCRC